MTEPHTTPAPPPVFSQASTLTISTWLDTPPPPNIADDLPLLRSHLDTLRACRITPQQRTSILGRLYTRGLSAVHALRPLLIGASLPISRKTRQLIRSQQDFLQLLAEDLHSCATEIDDTHRIRGLHQPQETILWRSLYALAQHLLIGNLVASPAGVGIWQQLHQTYETARHQGIAANTPEGASCSLQTIYYSAILLGCAQPASFTSSEVDFVAAYLDRFANRVDLAPSTAQAPAVFWIDPTRDSPAIACSRKSVPPATPVCTFSCNRLALLLKEQLASLKAGIAPRQINLPDFAGTPAGLGVLHRLITYWGEPGKRRFPRRRQNYRAVLCAGLNSLWHLFQNGDPAPIETSSWMIINESPDGYAVMHVSGKTSPMSVGDITAIRTETGTDWQVCVIRWALSENQEHLELGLQILSPHAVPATLAQHSETIGREHLSALILPEIPALRSTEMLVVPAGALENQSGKFVLVIEKENIEVREVENTGIDEQNSHVEIFSIRPATLSD